MQPAQDRIGADGIRFFAAMARIGTRLNMIAAGWIQSRYSRRIVPMTRSQTAFAFGLRSGDFNTVTRMWRQRPPVGSFKLRSSAATLAVTSHAEKR
jgi:hypothetical protein